ncbi:uncharacterized protein LOC121378871 [Gigantopelta aegis]|uniref:uncharacterized protein LOC121378871 n=1 Tax=Gigantopelta aegis TaxID=1735272 RepID=UPI001B88A5CF|nr:uncharacterized protein LOC121378871 [Gigantopelta aegis]
MKQKSDLDMADMLKKFKGASEFAKMVDVSKMNNLDIDQLGDMEGVAEVVDGTHKMAAAVVKSLKRKYGEVSDRNTNYTGQRFKKVVSLFIMGGRNDDIRRLPEDSTFVDGLKDVDVENMPQKKRQIVKEKLTKVYGLDEGSDVCVEPSIAQETAPFFADANKSLLTKFQAKSLRGLFKGLGKTMSALKKNTRAQMKLMTNAMSNIDNFGGKSSITMEDVAKYGPFMWCGASKELISKFEWDVFETFLEDIAQCASVHMDSDTKQAVVERLKNLADRNSVKISEEPERLASMGSLIYQYLATLQTDLANLSNDQKEALSTSTRSIFEGLARDREEKRLRNSKEVSEAEKTREHAEMADLAAFLMGVMQNVKARNEKDGVDGGGLPMGGRRRKRATDTITCDLLQDFNGELSFLSAAQVDTMDAADFVNCLPEFQKTDFAADVLVSLAAKLKAGINSDTRTWTADDVIAAGRLLDSLDDADIDKLLLSDDTVTGIAQHVFTKKDKLLLRYLTNTSQTDTSALTANTLSTLGNLACGLTDSHITAIPASVISEASTDLGSVPCFSEAQLTAMGTKIAEALGNDWTSKDPVVVAELGLLAGGLPQNVLEDFGEDLIGSMTKEAVAAVPTSVFSTVFTTDKLAYLSPEQANEVTDAQIGSLTAAQLSTLSGITTINIDTIFGSGSAVPTASVTVMTILTIGWMLLQN